MDQIIALLRGLNTTPVPLKKTDLTENNKSISFLHLTFALTHKKKLFVEGKTNLLKNKNSRQVFSPQFDLFIRLIFPSEGKTKFPISTPLGFPLSILSWVKIIFPLLPTEQISSSFLAKFLFFCKTKTTSP